MAWIKRNLFFVITVVVGLGLTGYCGYLLFSAIDENAAAMDKYTGARGSLDTLQKKVPFPSKENIAAVQADAARVQNLNSNYLKVFAGFPAPPKMEDRQFKDYLQKSIQKFGADATNAGVGMPAGYTFGFGEQVDKLNFPADNIGPWIQELSEIKAILQILYNAKINNLEQVKRPLVGPEDGGGRYCPIHHRDQHLGNPEGHRVALHGQLRCLQQ